MRPLTTTSCSAARAGLLLLLFSSAASAASAILGIDLGQEYIKTALVKPGIPLEIVLTKDTKRKEASAIGFKPSTSPTGGSGFSFPERLYGADAVNLAARFPHDVYPNLKQLLGQNVMEDVVMTYSARYPALSILPGPHRSTVAFKSPSAIPDDSGEGTFTVEELVAMQLRSIVASAEAMAGPGAGKIKDVVFTVPAFFLAEDKLALQLAAELAGLKVMSFVSDGLAVGINYATTRTFEENKPEYHLIYDMGAGSTTASVLKFQGKSVKDVGRFNKTIQEVSVLGVGYDKTLGGDLFNEKVVDILVEDFINSTKGKKVLGGEEDPKGVVKVNGRAAAKLWREATRVRQILSANTETLASIESLYSDVDFRSGKITRTTFEESISEYESRVIQPILDALGNAGVPLDQINSLILHGGAVRTPFVGKKLEEIMGGPERVSKNVNADEAAVMGATFRGADMSGSFRVKEIRVSDVNTYGVSIKYKKDETTTKETTRQIFTPGSKLDVEKIIPFTRQSEFSFGLIHNLPPRPTDPKQKPGAELLSRIDVRNLTESASKLKETFGCEVESITAMFGIRLDPKNGLPKVERGWAECEVEVQETEGKKEKDAEGVVEGVKGFFGLGKKKEGEQEVLEDKKPSSESATSSSTAEAEGATPASQTEAKTIKKIERISLDFTVTKDGFPEIPEAVKKTVVSNIAAYDKHDKDRRLLEEARNELEAFIYKVREYLQDPLFIEASLPETRTKLESLLSETADWLYGDDGHTAPLKKVKEKLKHLKALESPISKRKDENLKRPDQIKLLQDSIDQTKQLIEVIKGSAQAASAAAAAEASAAASPVVDDFAELEDKDDEATPPPKKQKTPISDSTYTPEEIDQLSTSYVAVEKWLSEKLEEQKTLKPHQDPAINTKDVEKKLVELNSLVMKLLQRKLKASSPPPPPPPKKGGKKGKESKTSTEKEKGSESDATEVPLKEAEEGEKVGEKEKLKHDEL